MRMQALSLSTALLLTLPFAAQAQEVSASHLSQALGMPGLQVKAVPKRRPQQVQQDYDVTDAAGKDIATVTTAAPAVFAEWKQMPGFEPVTGVGQEAYWRPGVDQLCARGAKASACVTLMPMAFPKDKKPTMAQLKAVLQGVI